MPPEGGERALVLGGGGSAGNAWEIGVVAGLLEAGVDVRRADLIIGTSAGATVAAQITGSRRPDDLLASILDAPVGRSAPARGGVVPVADHLGRTAHVIDASSDPADMRRRMGAAALAFHARSDGSGPARWRETVAARLAGDGWPAQRVIATTVDADSGEPVPLDRDSGVELVDAVAASTSNGFGTAPYPVGDRRLIDGGWRSVENAHLATGFARVLILSPFGGRTRFPEEWGIHLDAEIEVLRAAGSRVEAIRPDAASVDAFGTRGMMDPATRPPAARAGARQGRALAARLRGFWCRPRPRDPPLRQMSRAGDP